MGRGGREGGKRSSLGVSRGYVGVVGEVWDRCGRGVGQVWESCGTGVGVVERVTLTVMCRRTRQAAGICVWPACLRVYVRVKGAKSWGEGWGQCEWVELGYGFGGVIDPL